ncbi:hypothetical protein BGE01nite_19230 [Brevifollis gellanilyticus]|uniref:Uncharacterized protein n=1 Tax=Brevifollis gellanilyticus TaxID=748831 RepID=A0A512M7B7_9BACT|nr:hypothetical protein BGE01nite_19230 [Brevifollis gellanilyticus]
MNTFEARLGLFTGREREALAPGEDGKERPALPSGAELELACGADGMPRESKPAEGDLSEEPIMGRVGAPGIKALCP